MLPLFDAGYINIARQYLTIGINGLVEAAEFMGLKITPNEEYKKFVQGILGIIERCNKQYRTKDVMFNCEMIPAENVGVNLPSSTPGTTSWAPCSICTQTPKRPSSWGFGCSSASIPPSTA